MAVNLPLRSILYYPTINIPTGNWLRQALLYWDEIGSIVPEDFEEQHKLSPDIQFLANEGFYRPHRPYEAFEYDKNKRSFKKELKAIISSEEFLKLLPPKNNRRLDFMVYREKVLPPIYDILRSEGLAKKRIVGGRRYYFFEENTFYVYMSLLARYACWARSVMGMTIPSTNLPIYENLAFKTEAPHNGTPSFETYFTNLLPVPGPDTPLDDILSFKYRRKDELLRFRLGVNRLHSQLQSCKTREEACVILANFQEEIAVGLTNLRKSMKSDDIKILLGTCGSIITSNLGTVMNGTFDPIINGLPTLAGTVVVGYCLVKKINQQDIEAQSPVTYLFHVQEEFNVS